ncbi:hypothetical protein K491DRAFT_237795 [Lophiostoma macrostomum CBS 122681]|uniref:Uncharacterized protein n=1 Tax=Lophiostoma macrostomum CBS 122681 TaxID=1314788 RepID=A0A6A6THW6_9PLEO|nr:hypothetical protein K491DRAFT_237795 [Lophiostoma macrostomum CBS 122681]
MAPPAPVFATIPPRVSDEYRVSEESEYTRYSASIDSPILSPASVVSEWDEGEKQQPHSRIRHAVGIALLLATVFLWTTSNFLASTIFADDSYSKPYFVTYVNTSFFLIPLIPMFLKHAWDDRHTLSQSPTLSSSIRDLLPRRVGRYKLLRDHESATSSPSSKSRTSTLSDADELLLGDPLSDTLPSISTSQTEGLTLADTVKLSLEFCILWFLANYFAAACLEYTTVASSTILASTSSIFTLLFGSILRVERFTLRKMLGVCASLLGVILISSVDVSGDTDSHRGDFPHKTPGELALGDGMAFLSAVLYGFYAVFMKKRIGDESQVNMPLFFGLVGLFNVILLWPGLIILHVTHIEPFALPPTRKILTIVMVNSASSLVSDFCWAYAMLLTSPLIVTVGLSLTIPLSLVGQIVFDRQYASPLYWVGALVMVCGFWYVNQEGGTLDGGSNSNAGAGLAGKSGYSVVGTEEQGLGRAGPSSRGSMHSAREDEGGQKSGSKDV